MAGFDAPITGWFWAPADTRRVVVVERAAAHEVVRPHALEVDAVVAAQVLDRHLALDPLQLLVGYAGHAGASEAKKALLSWRKTCQGVLAGLRTISCRP